MDGDRTAHISDLSVHQDETRRLVRAMMTLTGLTASGLARASGLTPSTLNRFMHKDVGHTLSQRTMLALMAETFTHLRGRSASTLDPGAVAALAPAIPVYERGILELAPDARALLAEIKAISAGLPRASLAELPVVMATSQGIDVQTRDFARAPLKTARPPFLADDPLAFALLMPDRSMSPRYDAGDMLYVSPSRAADGEADVVVDKGAGFTVGTMAGQTATQVRLNILTPRSKVTFERSKIRGVYPIVGLQRLGM